MKNIISFLVLALVPVAAQAANLKDAFKPGGMFHNVAADAGYSEATSPELIIGRLISVALSVIGVLFLALMVYGGYLWMTDRGSNQQVDKAKSLISAAVIGLIIVLSAYAITYFVVAAIESQTLDTNIG